MTPAHSPENLRKTDELNVMHQKIDATKSYEKMYAESAKALKEMKRYCDTYLKNTTGQDNTVFAEKNISQKEKQSPFDKALLELMNTATLLSQKIDKVNIYNIAKTELLLKTGIHRPLSEHIFEDQTVERTKKNEIRGKLWNVWTRTTQELTAEVDSYEHLISDKFVSPEQRKIALINISQDVGQHMAYNSKESERAPYAKSLSEGKVIYALAYMNEFVGPFNVLYESLTERAKANNTDIVSFINKNVPASLRGDILGNLEAQVIGRNNLTNRLSLTANKSSQTLATDIMKYPAYTENFLNIRPHLRKTHPKRAMEIAKAFTRSNPNIYKLLTEKDKKQSSLELFTTKKFNCLSIYGPKGEGGGMNFFDQDSASWQRKGFKLTYSGNNNTEGYRVAILSQGAHTHCMVGLTKSTDSAILSDTGTIVSHAFAEAIKKGAIKGSPSEFNVIVARGHNYQTADMLKGLESIPGIYSNKKVLIDGGCHNTSKRADPEKYGFYKKVGLPITYNAIGIGAGTEYMLSSLFNAAKDGKTSDEAIYQLSDGSTETESVMEYTTKGVNPPAHLIPAYVSYTTSIGETLYQKYQQSQEKKEHTTTIKFKK